MKTFINVKNFLKIPLNKINVIRRFISFGSGNKYSTSIVKIVLKKKNLIWNLSYPLIIEEVRNSQCSSMYNSEKKQLKLKNSLI